MKISIITTTYRHERFVAATIESVLSQTFGDWEMLVGDDSPDSATWDVVSRYAAKDSRIRAWKNDPNLGIVGNLSMLLSKVSPESEYVAFLEGDDLFAPESLERRLTEFRAHPEVAMVYNNLDFVDSQ